MDRPSWAPEDVDLNQPSVARIWDWFLGGAHNFAVDRAVAQRMLEMMPEGPTMALINRKFLRRAVRFCVEAGVTQFLDLGSGIPTEGNTHEIAQQLDPDSRVVYADIDPVAVTHTRLLLDGDPRCGVLRADIRDPESILSAPAVTEVLDLSKPVAVLCVFILHFVPDQDNPRAVVARYRDAMASGSYLVISHGSEDPDQMPAEHLSKAKAMYRREVTDSIRMRTRPEVEALFDGFDLVEPGVTWLHQWRPTDPADADDPTLPHAGYGGVGRKP